MILRQLKFGALQVQQLFYAYYKGKTLLFLICSFYCCLEKKGSAMKVAQEFVIPGQNAYKPVAFKKAKYSPQVWNTACIESR